MGCLIMLTFISVANSLCLLGFSNPVGVLGSY